MRSWKNFLLLVMVPAVLSLTLVSTASAANKFQVLHSFEGKSDGAFPVGALLLDAAGNIYGTTEQGGGGSCEGDMGNGGCGTVFKLTLQPNGAFKETQLYLFQTTGDHSDGSFPDGQLIFDPAGNLYGTTTSGGSEITDCSYYSHDYGCGTVFELLPQPGGQWSESVLYRFQTGADGFGPYAGLILDKAGNLLGLLTAGGVGSYAGVAFLLSPGQSDWTESPIYNFCSLRDCQDGEVPLSALISDGQGNLYGTTSRGGIVKAPCRGSGCGTVFKLTPNPDGTWSETVLHLFQGIDGSFPVATLTFDTAGNLYGTTVEDGAFGYGTAFRLKPLPDGSWKLHVLYNFHTGQFGSDTFYGPWNTRLLVNAEGYLFGTTLGGGGGSCYSQGCGVVFRLKPGGKFGRWSYSVVHKFTAQNGDGGVPSGDLISDSKGNLYGVTRRGGTYHKGVVYKIKP